MKNVRGFGVVDPSCQNDNTMSTAPRRTTLGTNAMLQAYSTVDSWRLVFQ